MGERRAYTDTYNCGDSFTDWTLLQKSGEHVNPSVMVYLGRPNIGILRNVFTYY